MVFDIVLQLYLLEPPGGGLVLESNGTRGTITEICWLSSSAAESAAGLVSSCAWATGTYGAFCIICCNGTFA